MVAVPKNFQNWQTPPEAIVPLVKYLPKNARIWEPACGDGRIVSCLQEYGFSAFGSDILHGHDFMSYMPKQSFDMIISNPPFGKMSDFLTRCYDIGKPFALLLPLYGLESRIRTDLFRQHGVEVLLFDRRVRYFTPGPNPVLGKSPSFSSAWFCKQILSEKLVFDRLSQASQPKS
ncbi:MAG: hypothetical protein HQ567_33980 [Candidatus Nealsonbacteria bacterium]|nr:hypothetical protein [Candidatus Nealsonbacteria bacterium]